MRIEIAAVTKTYCRKRVFHNLSWQLDKGTIHVVTGPNGSGKTTLLRLVSGLEKPTSGRVIFQMNDKIIEPSGLRNLLGLVSPDLGMYSQLSSLENLKFFAALRGISAGEMQIKKLLEKFQLKGEINRPIVTFSTGMKQRLKLALALLNEPLFLLMDEPSTNLDAAGKELVADIIEEQARKGVILIATNEQGEVDRHGQDVLHLGQVNRSPGQKGFNG